MRGRRRKIRRASKRAPTGVFMLARRSKRRVFEVRRGSGQSRCFASLHEVRIELRQFRKNDLQRPAIDYAWWQLNTSTLSCSPRTTSKAQKSGPSSKIEDMIEFVANQAFVCPLPFRIIERPEIRDRQFKGNPLAASRGFIVNINTVDIFIIRRFPPPPPPPFPLHSLLLNAKIELFIICFLNLYVKYGKVK